MLGVAHEARVASYALEFDKNDDVVNFELGKATDELRRFAVRVVNNSWGKLDVNNWGGPGALHQGARPCLVGRPDRRRG